MSRLAERSVSARDTVAARLRGSGSVYAEEEADLLLDRFAGPELEAAVRERLAGVPLEHIVGWAQFADLRIAVAPGVFVPRRRTELLLELALANLPPRGTLVELCCGAAAVATAVATRRTDVAVHASDLDPVSVACARRNLEPVGGRVGQGDIDSGVPPELAGAVDVLVANAPYVPTEQIGLMPTEARDHEPRLALDGGADGTAVQARVVAAAGRLLRPGAVLLLECAASQAEATAALMVQGGLTPRVMRDEARAATCVVGRAPGPVGPVRPGSTAEPG